MTAADARTRLMRLQVERLDALDLGAEQASPYMRRLGDAIDDARTAFVATAVTEIAALRADLGAVAEPDSTFCSN